MDSVHNEDTNETDNINQLSRASASTSTLQAVTHSGRSSRAGRVRNTVKVAETANSTPVLDLPQSSQSSTGATLGRRRTRASAAAEQLQAHPPRESSPSSSVVAVVRDKGKKRAASPEPAKPNKRSKRTSTAPSGIVINKPAVDPKGKKRVAPSSSSEAEERPTTKRRRTTSSAPATTESTRASTAQGRKSKEESTAMPRKAKTSAKGKEPAVMKGTAKETASELMDEEGDVVMASGPSSIASGDEHEEAHEHIPIHTSEDGNEEVEGSGSESEKSDEDQEGNKHILLDTATSAPAAPSAAPPRLSAFEDAAAALFGGSYNSITGYMLGLSPRFKGILNNLKQEANPTQRLMALQELSELLSMSTEETLAGHFAVESFITELLKIMGGTGMPEDEDEEDGAGEGGSGEHKAGENDNDASLGRGSAHQGVGGGSAVSGGGRDAFGFGDFEDEDAQLRAAMALSTGGSLMNGLDIEAQVLACRCLANLLEALPGCAHTVVYHGAVPVLTSKLVQIEYIDLAEQTLTTLEKISQEFPSAVARNGGLSALLTYLDFFSTNVQRTALSAAANCCRGLSPENAPMVKEVFPIIRNVLSYSDQRLLESACLCVTRILDSYRNRPDLLESIVDGDLVGAINTVLHPSGGSPLVSATSYAQMLRSLAISAKTSPKVTITLLDGGITETLYQILTGVLPPAYENGEEQGQGEGGQGLGGGLADMAVMENLAHKPREQIEESLALICELMPPLPKEGIFDAKQYTEKALNKTLKAKRKSERAAARAAKAQGQSGSASPSLDPQDDSFFSLPVEEDIPPRSATPSIKEDPDAPPSRTDILREHEHVVMRFMRLILPILVDVYAASVAMSLRNKAMASILKAIAFLSGDELNNILRYVPVASFIGSIISSNDQTNLVVSAEMLIELLLTKLPDVYKPSFRREGVLDSLEFLADRELKKPAPKKEKESSADAVPPIPADGSDLPLPPPVPSSKRHHSHVPDPQDVVTLRARTIRAKDLINMKDDEGSVTTTQLKKLVDSLRLSDTTESSIKKTLKGIAAFFPPDESVSSFELMKTDFVQALLEFISRSDVAVPASRRQALFLEVFSMPLVHYPASTPFAILVKRLQELLTRMEKFEVVTISSSDDPKRGASVMLARQVRLRLVAEEASDIPRHFLSFGTQSHAILTFRALESYLHERILKTTPPRMSHAMSAFGTPAAQPSPASRGDVGEGPSNAAASSSRPTSSAPPRNRSAGTRRSLRLSGEGGLGSAIQAPVPQAAIPTSAPSVPEPEPKTPVENELEDDSSNPGVFIDDDIIGEDEDEDNTPAETTVDLRVTPDGTGIVAETPGGTRVATPSMNTHARVPPSPFRPSSYAAVLKAPPTDWHLEFTLDGQACPMDATLFGMLYKAQIQKAGSSLNVAPGIFWSMSHTLKFKKVPGPILEGTSEGSSRLGGSPQLSCIPREATHSSIVLLLRVLHKLNDEWADRALPTGSGEVLPESAFVNNKLSAKLTRQMEELMIVASSCLPDWAIELPQNFPFLFPFATRYHFVQSTSLGYARLLLRWQNQNVRESEGSRRNELSRQLSHLRRQKLRVARQLLLETAIKIMDMGFSMSSSVLEIEFYDEVGTGLGPTQEFYALTFKEFARRDLRLWRDADSQQHGAYVYHPNGLFPAPFPTSLKPDAVQSRLHLFRVLGQFVGKAMLDSRIIDIHFNRVFMKMIRGEEVPLILNTLRAIDPVLAKSVAQIQAFADAKAIITLDDTMDEDEKSDAILDLRINDAALDDLALDFTVPGYDMELKDLGQSTAVTMDNVEEYLELLLETLLGQGVARQVQAFKDGFSTSIPVRDLQTFTAEELVMMFGNSHEDWSADTLNVAVKADHGFTLESRPIRYLINIMANLDLQGRRDLLQFLTGSPKLPIGGFRGLNPPLTVVRKPHEPPLIADDYLPSVMTCVNYLKLPEYSSEEVMLRKLKVAMREGAGTFHLS
ncbi:hypothetical protein DACRYDRAFT_77036 [Dacryopinax primogenitus]|uniref:HECT-type E3 ubiquitin transferase n=1 Tax=Dacryopinax primogenitus (strain DJM 731) TaxID=1858805 RepID=M5GEN8_DACPD|nr:uncharacterized protein DACRYDRAFT_77036 [Dacryopinax primogenitus]EJU03433.1 hypothetical protein DACRYDRAFT_77036 [Dacryopinax primogenitus]